MDASGAVVAQYTYFPGTDAPHTLQRDGQTYYYVSDARANVVGLLDGAGNLVNEYHYSPWGNLQWSREAVPQPLRFSGREYDEDTGLYYFRARWYDPHTGRFVSEDPAGLGGGINPYAYAANDPVNSHDPTGLAPCNNGTNVIRSGGVCAIDGITVVGRRGGEEAPNKAWIDCRITVDCHDPAAEEERLQAIADDLAYQADKPRRDRAELAIASEPYNYSGLSRSEQIILGAAARLKPVKPYLEAAAFAVTSLPLIEGYGTIAGLGLAKGVGAGITGAASGGDHIVLGIQSEGLEALAQQLGGRHLMKDAAWRTTLKAAAIDRSTKFSINLNGFTGADHLERITLAARWGASETAKWTRQEMFILGQAGRLETANYYWQGVQVFPFGF
jgi:RHS repeat-associated protein